MTLVVVVVGFPGAYVSLAKGEPASRKPTNIPAWGRCGCGGSGGRLLGRSRSRSRSSCCSGGRRLQMVSDVQYIDSLTYSCGGFLRSSGLQWSVSLQR
jgi:hypothetical protein